MVEGQELGQKDLVKKLAILGRFWVSEDILAKQNLILASALILRRRKLFINAKGSLEAEKINRGMRILIPTNVMYLKSTATSLNIIYAP